MSQTAPPHLSSDPHLFVPRALGLLEAQFRTLALRALADWEHLDLPAPDLFRAVAALQRPAWGHWNGLLVALRDVRKNTLRTGSAADRDKVKQATTLETILEFLDREVSPELLEVLRALADLTRTTVPRKPRMATLLTLPISLRNLVAHFAPIDPAWWERAAQCLQQLLDDQQSGALSPTLPPAQPLPEPWFWSPPGSSDVYTFNGLREDTVLYAAPNGEPREVTAMLRPVLLAFQRLLGKTGQQEESLKRLLSRTAPEELKGVLLGDYLVGRPVGSGGYATVHVGTQLSTGRKVAVKILHDGMTEDARLRFHQEAVFLSRLNHPNIVSILGYGEETWSPPRTTDLARSLSEEPWFQELSRQAPVKSFIAMEWIDGPTLEDVYQHRRQPEPDTRQLATWFLEASQALGAVHGAGLIHRDVKPSNLMVTEQGTLTLMDFGIARTQDEIRTVVTTPDRPLGTPAYMAPEQIGVKDVDAEVGPGSDIYSLSATFYELFTRTRLFAHDTETLKTLETRKLSGARPTSPRRLVQHLPWELDTILLGGLERGVAERYHSMADLERDLRHYLRDEPIEYKRPSRWRRFRLWYRRNPVVANLGAVAATLLLVTAIVTTVAAIVTDDARGKTEKALGEKTSALGERTIALGQKEEALGEKTKALAEKTKEYNRAETEKGNAEKALIRETQQRKLAESSSYCDHVVLSDRQWFANNLADGEALLDQCLPELRGWEWHYLKRRYHSEAIEIDLPKFVQVTHLASSGDGKVAVGGFFGQVVLLPLPDTRPKSLYLHRGCEVGCLAFSPEVPSRYLVSAAKSRGFDKDAKEEVLLWNLSKLDAPITLPYTGARGLAFSPDGKTIALALADGTVCEWDFVAQKEVFSIKAFKVEKPDRKPLEGLGNMDSGHAPSCAAYSPDGKILVAGSQMGTIIAWDAQTHKELYRLAEPTIRLNSIDFSPDPKDSVYFTAGDGTVKLREGPTGKLRRTLPAHKGSLPEGSACFHYKSPWLATCGPDGVLRVWDVKEDQELIVFREVDMDARAVAFVGNTVIAGYGSGKLRIRNVFDDQRFRTIKLPAWSVKQFPEIALCPDQPLFVANIGRENTDVTIVNIHTLDVSANCKGLKSPPSQVAYAADGKLVAAAASPEKGPGEAIVWQAKTGNIHQRIALGEKVSGGLAFSPDSRYLAWVSERKPRFWDIQLNKPGTLLPEAASEADRLLFSPDGKLLVLLDDTAFQADVWDLDAAKKLYTIPSTTKSKLGLAFSRDGTWLAAFEKHEGLTITVIGSAEKREITIRNAKTVKSRKP